MIVIYNDIALVLTNDSYYGKNNIYDVQDESIYVVDFLDFSISGKIENNSIIELDNNEINIINERGWVYKYNSRPIKYWDKHSYKKYNNINIDNMSTSELINIIKKENSLSIKMYIGDLIKKGKIKKGDPFILKHEDYIKIYKNNYENNNVYYPLCNDQYASANNNKNWVYYMNYNCYIDNMGERCCCTECYSLPFREYTDYSINQLKNSHCYLCKCNLCICDNTKNIKNNINENIVERCNKCDICKFKLLSDDLI